MPDNIGIQPFVKTVVASTAVTASANLPTAGFEIPNDCEDFLLIADVTYTSGTTATLDIVFETSTDAVSTQTAAKFYMHSRYAQVTTASAIRILSVSRRRHAGQAASEYADANTGGAAANNGPMGRWGRFRCTTSGTNPTYSVVFRLIANRQVVY